MTEAGLRTVAFGDVDGGLWGAALQAGTGAAGLVLGAGEARITIAGEALRWTVGGRGWTLAGEGVTLEVQPRGEQPEDPEAEADPDVSGLQELCRVRGTVALDGSGHDVDCVAVRTEVEGLDAGALSSARAVSSWFGDDEAVTLVALRPRTATAHDTDLIAATLFDPDGWVPVADPRLSTSYTGAGEPSSTNLELWVGDGENEWPRRAAGEAAGSSAALQTGGLAVRVVPLRCHSRGLDGAGVYLLANLGR